MRIIDPIRTATGGQRQRQAAIFHCQDFYTATMLMMAGGTIDATEIMPAGAMNSIEWTNGLGVPVIASNETQRG